MKKNKNQTRRLNLSRETLAHLDPASLAGIGGAAAACQESHIVCSIIHTCFSCGPSEDTCA
jgi:hypothetical protein